MQNKINTHGLIMKNLRAASADTQRCVAGWRPYNCIFSKSTCTVRIEFADTWQSELKEDEFYVLYNEKSYASQQRIADAIARKMLAKTSHDDV